MPKPKLRAVMYGDTFLEAILVELGELKQTSVNLLDVQSDCKELLEEIKEILGGENG